MLLDVPRPSHRPWGWDWGTDRSMGRVGSTRQAELLKETCWGLPASSCHPPRPFAGALSERVGLAWAHEGEVGLCGALWGLLTPTLLRCTAPSAAPGQAASHPGALILGRQALRCSLSLPVTGSEPKWNVGGLCGLGLPTLPEVHISSWGGVCGSASPIPREKSPQKLRAILGQVSC